MNFDFGGEAIFLGDFREIRPGADKPFIRLPRGLHLASVNSWRQSPAPPNERTPICSLVSVGFEQDTRATLEVQGGAATLVQRRVRMPARLFVAGLRALRLIKQLICQVNQNVV